MQRLKLMGLLLVVCALGATSLACGDPPPAPTPPAAEVAETPLAEMTVADVAGRIARGERLAVVDVNNAEKYAAGHVPGAINMRSRPIVASALPSDRATPLVFYCWDEH